MKMMLAVVKMMQMLMTMVVMRVYLLLLRESL